MFQPASLRALARSVKRAPERTLHTLRRRRARRHVAALAPRSLLFLCHGNICRSPFAAGAARARLGETTFIAVDSAGLMGPDRASPPEAVQAARVRGVDLKGHRSKLFTAAMARCAGLVIVMDPAQVRAAREAGAPPGRILVLGDLDPLPIDSRTIPDPVEKPLDAFAACYERIDHCVTELAGLVAPGSR